MSLLRQAVAASSTGASTPAHEAFDPVTHRQTGSPIEFALNGLQLPSEPRLGQAGSEYDETRPSCVVISGGSGANAICDAFLQCFSTCTFILPISDNGGSSSELIRCLGGPSIGDIRSRLIRLIPTRSPDNPSEAIKKLLAYRLSGTGDSRDIKQTWLAIVEGRHPLWRGIPADRRETIRAFLVHLESELLKRAHKRFNFKHGSIGNLFIAGALSFFRSIESAIFLFQTVTGIPERLSVIPCIFTNSIATIAAGLQDGSTIVGQTEISHPTSDRQQQVLAIFEGNVGMILGDDDHFGHGTPLDEDETDTKDVDNNISFDKGASQTLPSPILDISYINSFGRQVWPRPNPRYLAALATSDALIYSCGSLYTSIVPCLAIMGVGKAIATSPSLRWKVLLLNAVYDRETPEGTTALDYIQAIQRCLNKNMELADQRFAASDYFTHLIYLKSGQIPVDREAIELLGVRCVEIKSAALFTELNVHTALSDILGEQV